MRGRLLPGSRARIFTTSVCRWTWTCMRPSQPPAHAVEAMTDSSADHPVLTAHRPTGRRSLHEAAHKLGPAVEEHVPQGTGEDRRLAGTDEVADHERDVVAHA